jgi:two-component system sensor histidine kinase HydH
MMADMFRRHHLQPEIPGSNAGYIIFVGLDMDPIDAARKADTRHTIIMALILLLIGFAGIGSLFLAQAYRSAKTSLTRIKAFSDNVVENMPIGLVAIDGDGRIASFNQTAESVLQLASHESLGKNAGDVLPRVLWSLTGELETDQGIIEREIDCPLEDGKIIPLDSSVSLLEGQDGTFLGYIILFRDLTEVQNLKREVERSQRLASLGRLAAGVAHEIRNPLSSIKGFATYFRERYKEIPEDQRTAEIMVQEVDRLNRVITQLLDFARPLTINKRSTPLQGLIQHSLKMIEGQAREKNIQISTGFSPEIKEISIDPDKINQVLLNLYLNAMEAMEHGGALSVDVLWDEDSQRTMIRVSDNGAGISKKDLIHIFDPYFTTKQSGTGLGLAIVHKIVESHGGEVRVGSETGKGTTVTIYLP